MARSSAQSAQRYPLTEILGTETNVRLLRELSRHGGQLSAPSLVSRTGLAKASVWAGLAALEWTGTVSVVGTGRARLYSLRADHPLKGALDALFDAEERRFEAVLDAIREAGRRCGSAVVAVWLYGSVARGEDGSASDLDIAVVAVDDAVEAVRDAIRESLRPAGERLGFTPSVVGIGTADPVRLSRQRHPWWNGIVRDAVVLLGPSPDSLVQPHRAARKKAGGGRAKHRVGNRRPAIARRR
jgi:predicted nucleotidyltransferase